MVYFTLQKDGNLVGYSGSGAIWQIGISQQGSEWLGIANGGEVSLHCAWGVVWTPAGLRGPPQPWPSWNGNAEVQLGLPRAYDKASLLAYINQGRAAEGVGGMVLPINYDQLSGPEQLFTLINLEREDRGIAPFAGEDASLVALAQVGADNNTDPAQSFSIWANAPSPLAAVALFMYDDGWSGFNIDCHAPGEPGCFGHTWNILRTDWMGFGGIPAIGCAQGAWNPSSLAAAEMPLNSVNTVFSWDKERPYL